MHCVELVLMMVVDDSVVSLADCDFYHIHRVCRITPFRLTLEKTATQKTGTYHDIIPYIIGAPSIHRPYSSIIKHGKNNNFTKVSKPHYCIVIHEMFYKFMYFLCCHYYGEIKIGLHTCAKMVCLIT